MFKFSWCRKRLLKRRTQSQDDMRAELELVCSRILGLYLNAELIKDRTQQPLDDLLQEGIDRALIAASELDKKYGFGLF